MIKVLSKVAAAAALVAAAGSSHAYLIFEVSQFGGSGANPVNTCNTQTLAGCGAGSGFSISTNLFGETVVTYTGIVGDYAVSTTSTVSNTPGTPEFAVVSTTALDVRRTSGAGGAGATMFIGVRAFNFSQPNGELKTLEGSSGMSSPGGFGSGTITSDFWADANNLGDKVAANNINCSYPLAASAACNAPNIQWADPAGSGGGMFSLRSEHQFRLTNGSRFEGTTSLIARNVPEPMTLSLVGAALLAAAGVARRRASKA